MAALVPAGCSQWKMVETAPAPGGRDITSRARGLGPLEQMATQRTGRPNATGH